MRTLLLGGPIRAFSFVQLLGRHRAIGLTAIHSRTPRRPHFRLAGTARSCRAEVTVRAGGEPNGACGGIGPSRPCETRRVQSTEIVQENTNASATVPHPCAVDVVSLSSVSASARCRVCARPVSSRRALRRVFNSSSVAWLRARCVLRAAGERRGEASC